LGWRAEDVVYITVGRRKIARTEEAGPFIYDIDAEGHIVGIEILSASKVLAPEDWKKLIRRARRASAQPNSGTTLRRPELDLRDPRILAEIRRESSMLSKHPGNAAIDD
jgi:uncharacterized protein YuzE